MSTIGGARTGAGRPRLAPGLKKIQVSYRLPPRIVQWMRAHERSAAWLIEDALIARHGLENGVPIVAQDR